MTDAKIVRAALPVVAELQAQYAEYLAECEADHAAGFRAHYCEHGTDLWTDYDNICGPCEDGITLSDGVHLRRVALDIARERIERSDEMIAALFAIERTLDGLRISGHDHGEIFNRDALITLALDVRTGKRRA